MTGCLFLFVLIVGFILVIRFAATPRVRQLKDVPSIVPATVPIYDKDNIDQIRYVSAKERSKTVELAAIIPKAILIPLYFGTEEYLPEDIQHVFDSGKEENGWERYIRLIREPIFPKKDLVEIEWRHLSAQPIFIKEFYEKELLKQGFDVIIIVTESDIEELRFTDKEKTITGTFYTEDDHPEERGTDMAVLKIEFSETQEEQ